MQAVTHFLVGVQIDRATRRIPIAPLRAAAVLAAGTASHVILDDISYMTYHPGFVDLRDPFWVAYHAVVLATSLYVLIRWRRHADR